MITRRGFLRAARNVFLGGAVSAVGGWKYMDFETTWFKLTSQEIMLPTLPSAFNGIKIAHLSDFHLGEPITPERLNEVVNLTNDQKPDLIVNTGDFIDRYTNLAQLPEYISIIRELKSNLGHFAVLGNHDHRENGELVRSMLVDCGITELQNQTRRVSWQGEDLYLCGLDSFKKGKTDMEAVLEGLPDGEKGILLIHEPDYADISAKENRFCLQLSGHSHGGQVVIPFLGPPITSDYGEKYIRGMYKIGEMQLFTTTGIGTIYPNVRLNCRPEVAVLTLRSG